MAIVSAWRSYFIRKAKNDATQLAGEVLQSGLLDPDRRGELARLPAHVLVRLELGTLPEWRWSLGGLLIECSIFIKVRHYQMN